MWSFNINCKKLLDTVKYIIFGKILKLWQNKKDRIFVCRQYLIGPSYFVRALHKWQNVKMTHWEIGVSECFNFYPSSTNSTSYKSWHLQLKFETSLRSLKLIVWPEEVSEVSEVKMKKILCIDYKIVSFWPRKFLYTSKCNIIGSNI